MGSAPGIDEIDADFVEVCIMDTCGIRRSKTVTKSYLPDIMRSGLGYASVAMYLPPYGDYPADGCSYTATGEYRIIPDMTTFKKLPWRNNTGHAFGDLYSEDGQPSPECPRGILRRAIDLLKKESGFDLKIGFETEFILLKPNKDENSDELPRPLCDHAYASQNDMIVHAEVLEDIVKTLQQLDIVVLDFHPESSPGQYEIVTGPGDPLTTCDNVVLTRFAIVAIAARHGLEVTFLPKYFSLAAGSGLHVHMSLSKDGVDVTAGSEPKTLSNETQYIMNGILEHLRDYYVFTGSTPGSFARNAPGCLTGFLTIWGINNREAMLRVLFPSSAGPKKSVRFEHRCLDPTANTYVGLACVLLAGVLGLRHKRLLPPATQEDPATLTEKQMTERRAVRYPSTMSEAVDAFEQSTEFKKLLTEVSSEHYVVGTIAVRKSISKFFTSFEQTPEAIAKKEKKLLYYRY